MYMRIRCDYCNQYWDVYGRDDLDGAARRCPHCDAKINKETWKHCVVPAFKAAESANLQLYSDHANDHMPLFTVTFIPDHIFPARSVADVLANEEIIPNWD